ncbi:MAG: hypothetical protein IT185_10595 [Acidobacteria bacterium]|nr:hypothetical protein [Acidobacteriota bacterium]
MPPPKIADYDTTILLTTTMPSSGKIRNSTARPSVYGFMRLKLLHVSLIIASLMGYLEWGGGQSVFLFQAEAQLVAKALEDPAAALHPFTVLPMLGQLALLVTLFQRTPSRGLAYAGVAGIGVLLGLMLLIGVMSMNLKIAVSCVPFLIFAVMTVRAHRRR